MRASALSAAALSFAGIRRIPHRNEVIGLENAAPPAAAWNAETFAEEQIRGLVRQVFSPALSPPVQQVVFSSIEPETAIQSICQWVGEVLAQERTAEIALIDESELDRADSCAGSGDLDGSRRSRSTPILQFAKRIHRNLWLVPARSSGGDPSQKLSLGAYMTEIRREFEYSIVVAPASATCGKALEMARFADGIILVLSAQRTRRITALKVKNAFAQVRLLGIVLSEREFPIPASIYRRL